MHAGELGVCGGPGGVEGVVQGHPHVLRHGSPRKEGLQAVYPDADADDLQHAVEGECVGLLERPGDAHAVLLRLRVLLVLGGAGRQVGAEVSDGLAEHGLRLLVVIVVFVVFFVVVFFVALRSISNPGYEERVRSLVPGGTNVWWGVRTSTPSD